MKDILYIVVPCYNEEEVLPETARRLRTKLEELIAGGTVSPRSRVLFVNDGSRDRTWELICQLHQSCAGRTCPGTGDIRTRCWPGS